MNEIIFAVRVWAINAVTLLSYRVKGCIVKSLLPPVLSSVESNVSFDSFCLSKNMAQVSLKTSPK